MYRNAKKFWRRQKFSDSSLLFDEKARREETRGKNSERKLERGGRGNDRAGYEVSDVGRDRFTSVRRWRFLPTTVKK